LGFTYNISATAEASDFEFGMKLGFAKGHDKITCRRNRGRGFGLGKLPKIWRSPFNIYKMAEASYLKCGTQVGFVKASHKTTHKKKWL